MKIEACHIYLAMNIYDTAFHILLVVVFFGRNRLIDTFFSTLHLNTSGILKKGLENNQVPNSACLAEKRGVEPAAISYQQGNRVRLVLGQKMRVKEFLTKELRAHFPFYP